MGKSKKRSRGPGGLPRAGKKNAPHASEGASSPDSSEPPKGVMHPVARVVGMIVAALVTLVGLIAIGLVGAEVGTVAPVVAGVALFAFFVTRKTPHPGPPRDWKEIARSYGLLLFSAILMFLGFAGFGVWPLAFVGMVPALFVIDADPKPIGRKFFFRALFFGYVAYYGGFYWVVDTIVDFGGFPYLLALLFASIYFLYQAFEFVLILWLFRRARERGWNATLCLVAAYLTAETIFPMLFDHYYGNSFHMLPHLVQVVDLGGPMLLTGLAMAGNGALYEVIRARVRKEPTPWIAPAVFAGALAFTLGYGVYRIDEVETRMARAPKITVGVVQTNMGIFQKHEDPGEGLERHLEQSLALEAQGPLDLLVWPESAATFRLPRELGTPIRPYFENALRYYRIESPGFPRTPMLFGGLSANMTDPAHRSSYNTAFITDERGLTRGHYDKTYLLAFGEYLPFGDTFPILHEWSPNTGHFSRGDHVDPVPLGDYRISVLVCYEDVIPRFTRQAVREGDPHLLVNITNDAWFGETQEPYVHLALATFRAAEHHRYLIRATNTGVSAIVDPLGRRVEEGGLFERASLRGEVAMMNGWTLYQTLGDWPGWLALAAMLSILFVFRRNLKEESPPPEEEPRLDHILGEPEPEPEPERETEPAEGEE
jgi:apolipoprotein N-acyltransferase